MDQAPELKGGIMIYGDGEKSRFATVHDVLPKQKDDDVPELGPGVLISRDSAIKMVKGLEDVPEERFFLPKNVICWDLGILCWWRPAGRRRIFFHAKNDALNALSGQEVMHPPLFFCAHRNGLSIWALGKDERPSEDTPLYRAPYFNLHSAGNMCAGSVRYPEHPRPDNIDQWEECFFGSNFVHGNTQELTTHPKGHTGYWVALSKGNATKSYAMKYLQEIPLNVMGVIKASIRETL